MKLGSAVIVAVLSMETACQLVVDVSDYRFSDADAGGAISELGPLQSSDGFSEPRAADAAATPREPGLDSGSDAEEVPAEQGLAPEPEPPEPEPAAAEPDPPPPAEPSPPDPENGCSIIEYCYAHQVQDTTDEERCIQQGCSLDEAIAECRAEIAVRCGSAPRPPYVMITQSGERVILN
jgi:hypothetical protein